MDFNHRCLCYCRPCGSILPGIRWNAECWLSSKRELLQHASSSLYHGNSPHLLVVFTGSSLLKSGNIVLEKRTVLFVVETIYNWLDVNFLRFLRSFCKWPCSLFTKSVVLTYAFCSRYAGKPIWSSVSAFWRVEDNGENALLFWNLQLLCSTR